MAKSANEIIPVKLCYGHVGGRLGNLLMEQFIEKGWIRKVVNNERLYSISKEGKAAFTKMGVDLSLIPTESLEN